MKERLKEYLQSELECYPDDNELETIIGMAGKQIAYEANAGYRVSRIADNDREKAFHDQWLEENEPKGYINNGNGILQDLFIDSKWTDVAKETKVIEEITLRDRRIVATVIQWLGSNVGMAFLNEALRRFNAHITYSVPTENVGP